jgi:hypothetical protein
MSPELPRIDYGEFRTNRNDFSEIYRDADEPLPHRMPTPRGRGVMIRRSLTHHMPPIKLPGDHIRDTLSSSIEPLLYGTARGNIPSRQVHSQRNSEPSRCVSRLSCIYASSCVASESRCRRATQRMSSVTMRVW